MNGNWNSEVCPRLKESGVNYTETGLRHDDTRPSVGVRIVSQEIIDLCLDCPLEKYPECSLDLKRRRERKAKCPKAD